MERRGRRTSGQTIHQALDPFCDSTATGDDGADARQRCLKDCIKKNCHAQKFNIRRVPPMESMVDRIYAQQQMNRVEGRQSLPIRPGTHNHGGEANGVPPKL